MQSCIYISEAKRPFTVPEIDELGVRAASFNADVDITGYLYFHRDRFVQFLEGPTAGLDQVLDRIRADERHEIPSSAVAPGFPQAPVSRLVDALHRPSGDRRNTTGVPAQRWPAAFAQIPKRVRKLGHGHLANGRLPCLSPDEARGDGSVGGLGLRGGGDRRSRYGQPVPDGTKGRCAAGRLAYGEARRRA